MRENPVPATSAANLGRECRNVLLERREPSFGNISADIRISCTINDKSKSQFQRVLCEFEPNLNAERF